MKMGVTIEVWRQRIGTFSQPVRCKSAFNTLQLKSKYISLCIRTVLFLMLVVQGVESNPGPPPGSINYSEHIADHINSQSYGRGGSRGRGAEGTGRGNSRGNSRGSGRGRGHYDVRDLSERRITRSQSERVCQPEITSWLGISQESQSRSATGGNLISDQSNIRTMNMGAQQVAGVDGSESDSQSDRIRDIEMDREGGRVSDRGSGVDGGGDLQNSGDVRELLIDIRREMRYMNQKFDKLEDTMTSLKQDNKTLKKQNKELTKQVQELSFNVQEVSELAQENERKNERLESQSRRENLKFYGLDENRKETWEESENKVRNYIAEGLNIDESDIKIERAHRLGGNKSGTRPIIAKFSFYKDKEKILRAYREKKKAIRARKTQRDDASGDNVQEGDEQGDNQPQGDEDGYEDVRVSEDFVERVANVRTKLFPFMMDCIKDGKNAYLKYDKLVVDDIVHDYDNEKKVPVAVPPSDK